MQLRLRNHFKKCVGFIAPKRIRTESNTPYTNVLVVDRHGVRRANHLAGQWRADKIGWRSVLVLTNGKGTRGVDRTAPGCGKTWHGCLLLGPSGMKDRSRKRAKLCPNSVFFSCQGIAATFRSDRHHIRKEKEKEHQGKHKRFSKENTKDFYSLLLKSYKFGQSTLKPYKFWQLSVYQQRSKGFEDSTTKAKGLNRCIIGCYSSNVWQWRLFYHRSEGFEQSLSVTQPIFTSFERRTTDFHKFWASHNRLSQVLSVTQPIFTGLSVTQPIFTGFERYTTDFSRFERCTTEFHKVWALHNRIFKVWALHSQLFEA